MELLIDNGANPNAISKSMTPLYLILTYLCKYGINTQNKDHYYEAITLLLNEGADTTASPTNENSYLYLAKNIKVLDESSQQNKDRIVLVIQDKNNVQSAKIFVDSIVHNQFEQLKNVIQNMKETGILDTIINIEIPFEETPLTPIIAATKYCTDPRIFDVLLRAGADVNKKNSRGETPLYCVLENASNIEEQNTEALIKTIKLLIDNGADVINISNDSKTALDMLNADKKIEYLQQNKEYYVNKIIPAIIKIIQASPQQINRKSDIREEGREQRIKHSAEFAPERDIEKQYMKSKPGQSQKIEKRAKHKRLMSKEQEEKAAKKRARKSSAKARELQRHEERAKRQAFLDQWQGGYDEEDEKRGQAIWEEGMKEKYYTELRKQELIKNADTAEKEFKELGLLEEDSIFLSKSKKWLDAETILQRKAIRYRDPDTDNRIKSRSKNIEEATAAVKKFTPKEKNTKPMAREPKREKIETRGRYDVLKVEAPELPESDESTFTKAKHTPTQKEKLMSAKQRIYDKVFVKLNLDQKDQNDFKSIDTLKGLQIFVVKMLIKYQPEAGWRTRLWRWMRGQDYTRDQKLRSIQLWLDCLPEDQRAQIKQRLKIK